MEYVMPFVDWATAEIEQLKADLEEAETDRDKVYREYQGQLALNAGLQTEIEDRAQELNQQLSFRVAALLSLIGVYEAELNRLGVGQKAFLANNGIKQLKKQGGLI